jgi:hypothetical protein
MLADGTLAGGLPSGVPFALWICMGVLYACYASAWVCTHQVTRFSSDHLHYVGFPDGLVSTQTSRPLSAFASRTTLLARLCEYIGDQLQTPLLTSATDLLLCHC